MHKQNLSPILQTFWPVVRCLFWDLKTFSPLLIVLHSPAALANPMSFRSLPFILGIPYASIHSRGQLLLFPLATSRFASCLSSKTLLIYFLYHLKSYNRPFTTQSPSKLRSHSMFMRKKGLISLNNPLSIWVPKSPPEELHIPFH